MSVLIIGGGSIGKFLAERLVGEGKSVVVVEKDERKARELDDELDVKVVVGNGASPKLLHEVGLKDAEMVIAVTDSDEVNLLSVILAGRESETSIKVARMRSPEFGVEGEKFQRDFGINLLINPEREAAKAVLKVLEVPGATEIMDFFGEELQLVGTRILSTSKLIKRPLKELRALRDEEHFLIAAIFRSQQLIIPTGETVIEPGDVVYFISEKENVNLGMRLLGYRGEKVSSVMINGGTFIGMNLARVLEEKGVDVKVIECDPHLCSVLSRNLNKSIILNASAVDQDFLREENISNMDAFVAVSTDDENNILSALLARRLGAPWTIAVTNEVSYMSLVSAIGVDVVISPRQLTNSTILQFVRRGKVFKVSSLQDAAEIIEVEALETSDIVGRPIHKLKIPKDILVLAVGRGKEIIIPRGDTIIEPHDRVVLMAAKGAVRKIEKLVTVKLEYF